MPKKKTNAAMKEAEVARLEELNKREEKALEKKAALLLKKKELEAAESGDETPAADEHGEGIEGQGYQISQELSTVLSQIEDGGRFEVSRIVNGREQRVGIYSISDFPARLEEIAHECGGGTFKVKFRDSAGLYIKQLTETFDPLFYGKKERTGNGQGDMTAVLAEIQRTNMSVLDSVRRENSEIMRTLIQTLGAQKPTGFLQNAQDVAAIAGLFKRGGDDGNAIELFMKGLALGKELGGGEPPSTLDKVLEAVGKPFAETISKVVAAAPTMRPARPGATPKPLPGTEPGLIENPPTKEDPAVTDVKNHLFYKMYAPQILRAATRNEDPALWGEKIVNTVPESYHAMLLDIVENPELVEFLAAYEPDVRTYADWFKKLAAAVKEQFEDAPEGETEEAPEQPAPAVGLAPGQIPPIVMEEMGVGTE